MIREVLQDSVCVCELFFLAVLTPFATYSKSLGTAEKLRKARRALKSCKREHFKGRGDGICVFFLLLLFGLCVCAFVFAGLGSVAYGGSKSG